MNEAVLVAGSGDGSLLIVDQTLPNIHGQLEPAAVLVGHTAEASTRTHSWGVNRSHGLTIAVEGVGDECGGCR